MEAFQGEHIDPKDVKNSKNGLNEENETKKYGNSSHVKPNKFIMVRNQKRSNESAQNRNYTENPEIPQSNIDNTNYPAYGNYYSDNQLQQPNHSFVPNTFPQQHPNNAYYDQQRMYNTTGLYDPNYVYNPYQPQYPPQNGVYQQSQYLGQYPPPPPYLYSQNISQAPPAQYIPPPCQQVNQSPSPPIYTPPPTTLPSTVPPQVEYVKESEESESVSESVIESQTEIENEIENENKKKEKEESCKNDENVYSIKVDGINESLTEKAISDLFGITGNFLSCKMINEGEKRVALVEYSTEESASKAINKFNEMKLKGSKITVSWYNKMPMKKNNRIILKNLPYNVDEEKIRNICDIVGEIESLEIIRPEDENGRSKCIIYFKDEESIETAKIILEDSEFDGLKAELVVDREDRIKNDVKRIKSAPNKPDSKHVDDEKETKDNTNTTQSTSFNPPNELPKKSLPPPPFVEEEEEKFKKPQSAPVKDSPHIDQPYKPVSAPVENNNSLYIIEKSLIIRNFTEDEVREIFSKYNIKLITKLTDYNSYQVFLRKDDANSAYSKLNCRDYNDKRIVLSWGNDRRVKRDLNTVFVGCLSENVTEDDLEKEFSKIGEIDSLKIFRQKVKGKSPDYAYINFVDKECIDKAIKQLNGIDIKGRFITVQYPKKKK